MHAAAEERVQQGLVKPRRRRREKKRSKLAGKDGDAAKPTMTRDELAIAMQVRLHLLY